MPITRRRRSNPDQPENNDHLANQTGADMESLIGEQAPIEKDVASTSEDKAFSPNASPPISNGDRAERQDHTTPIEGGRRTARGELFRRPPQVPVQSPIAPPLSSIPVQAPTHEISLPLGNLLHLAYNPGYTGADEARSTLLSQLTDESKSGGRARCWNCGSLAIIYDRWNTRSKTFGEIGIAFCEICSVWSIM